MTPNNILTYISLILGLFVLIIHYLSKNKPFELKLISIYILFELATDLFLNPISKTLFKSEYTAAHIFTLVEFFIFSLIFRNILELKSKRFIFWLFSYVFILTFIYENFVIKNIGFDSISVGISNIILTTYSILCLSKFLKQAKPESILHLNFFITASSVIYFAGTLFIYTLFNSYIENNNFSEIYYFINPTVITIRNILLVAGAVINFNLQVTKKIIPA